jgi:glutaconyl-CoA/methylmalonyl-CoA decarboxylase subunit gamma
MKYKIQIDHHLYEVEINNVRATPVIAYVNGEPFEVWQDNIPTEVVIKPEPLAPSQAKIFNSSANGSIASVPRVTVRPESMPTNNGNGLRVVRAPIPGVITGVDVEYGNEVTVGQQLCVLEAMKMNNSIRASRAGRIGRVHITIGQQVRHNDIMIEYDE